MSHTPTVRYRIIMELARRLGALSDVGQVVMPGADGDSRDQITRTVSEGKVAVVITTTHDTPDVIEAGQREASTETVWFDVGLILNMPAPATASLSAGAFADYEDLASWLHGQVQRLYNDADGTGGEWYESSLPQESESPPLVPLAINTVCLGGGAPIVDEVTNLPATESAFRITYRTLRSDYGAPVA